jgi:hypothetical protein
MIKATPRAQVVRLITNKRRKRFGPAEFGEEQMFCVFFFKDMGRKARMLSNRQFLPDPALLVGIGDSVKTSNFFS